MSALDSLMLCRLRQGAAVRIEVARAGESLTLKAELVYRVTREGAPAESSRTIHEETGPEGQVIRNMYNWLGENVAELMTKRTA